MGQPTAAFYHRALLIDGGQMQPKKRAVTRQSSLFAKPAVHFGQRSQGKRLLFYSVRWPTMKYLNKTLCFCALSLHALIGLNESEVMAQQRPPLGKVNYLLDASGPPGSVAQSQIARRVNGVGTFQAVSITGPEGIQIGLARDGMFLEPIAAPVTTGMLVGGVYRFRVTNIPLRPGVELFPTVEVIDRINAPAGREHRFPIPLVLTAEDLNLALSGAMVTRVVYLEDSENASPFATSADDQLTRDVGPLDNALQEADRFGKPVAILRIGSRVPTNLQGDLTSFLYGCPPWIPLNTVPNREQMIEQGQWAPVETIERTNQPYPETPDQDYPRIPMR